MNDLRTKNLLIGFGSEIITDQGVIHRLLKDLKPEFTDDLNFCDELIVSLDLIHQIEGYKRLLILDTVHISNEQVGAIQFCLLNDSKQGIHLGNYHDCSIIEIIETAIRLGFHVPREIVIMTINTKEIFAISNKFTPEMKKKYPELLQQVKTLVRQFFHIYSYKELIID